MLPFAKISGNSASCRLNTTKIDKKLGIYTPRLTLYVQRVSGGYRRLLYIEFSAPKLIYGNNFTEIGVPDYGKLCNALSESLAKKGVHLSPNQLRYAEVKASLSELRKMLSEAHTEKNKYYDIRRAELETAKKQIQRRQRNLFDKYMDNDGSNIVGITQEFYDENMSRYADELTEIERQQQRLDSMDQGYYVTVEYLLNLFEHAADIFKVANSNEKRRILSMLLSNLEFDGKNLVCTLKEPLSGLFLKKNEVRYGRGDRN